MSSTMRRLTLWNLAIGLCLAITDDHNHTHNFLGYADDDFASLLLDDVFRDDDSFSQGPITGGNDQLLTSSCGDDVYSSWEPKWDPVLQLPEYNSCGSPSENARGEWTADLAPCLIAFHHVDNEAIIEDAAEANFRMSTACGNDTLLLGAGSDTTKKLFSYVKEFPDECVADFNRCYSMEGNTPYGIINHINTFICKHQWKLPSDTTHVSVDCTQDKELKEQAIYDYIHKYDHPTRPPQETAHERQRKALNELEIVLAIVCGLLIMCCSVSLVVLYCCFLRPFVLQKASQEGGDENIQLVESSLNTNGDDHVDGTSTPAAIRAQIV